jgi:hypothetical protein
MKGLTKETAEALKFTAQSTAECIQFLLQDLGFYYILTRTFSSDAIESMFSDVRLKGGSQDATDAEAAENAIKRILQCGLIKTSLSANVFSECDYSSNIELIPSDSKNVGASFTIDELLALWNCVSFCGFLGWICCKNYRGTN